MRILVVDDSKAMRMIVARTLRLAGFAEHDVVHAQNGQQALEIVRDAGDEPIGLVLCDWNMPEMSGMEVLATLRASAFDMPFGFVTSESSPGMREYALTAGASFLISKPFTPEDFQDALDSLLA